MRRSAQQTYAVLAGEEVPELTSVPDGISLWTGADIDALRRTAARGDNTGKKQEDMARNLCRTIDILGIRSQRAQGINAVLTSVARLRENNTSRLYLLTENHRGVGILKVGVKKLFVTHPVKCTLVEVDPLCVLDFYVDESCQRKGYGQQLYDHMLKAEKISRPEELAIDRPSKKLLNFIKKHYRLTAYTPQANNFVVFHRFFDDTTVSERGKLLRASSPMRTQPASLTADAAAAPNDVRPKNRMPG